MRSWRKVILIVMASVLAFLGGGGSTFASNFQSVSESEIVYQDSDVENAFKKMNDLASTTNEVKDTQRIQDIKNMSKDVISEKKVVLNNSNANLDFDNAKYLDITKDNMTYTSITVPITGEGYSFTSNFTLVFDSHNKVINYSEALITKSDSNKFVITTYSDGELVQNKETDLDYISDSELKRGLEVINEDGYQIMGVKKIAACIAAIAGVNAVVAYLIAGTCVASCPAVPPICAACIGGVATMGAADIVGIMGCFKL
ncbi:hypothetical protein [Amphibacillus cookii]|uniref:hypothetical protein n=1 Tax=Amphibacillus cookii TaxID=767787 RepID=UPI00195EF6F6|nr:hypothetical protein [Amphibacillus cookii]MBM7541607.1 hypothetical protein [Amphibacillus cookii]